MSSIWSLLVSCMETCENGHDIDCWKVLLRRMDGSKETGRASGGEK